MFGRTKKPAHKSRPFAAFALLTVIIFLMRKFFKKAVRRRRVNVAQGEPFPYLQSVSARTGCDIEGLRFLAGALTPMQITEATGRPARSPIRVYAGLAHGVTPAARVAYAMNQMEMLGAFEREYLLVVSPTGRGYVHPIPAETAELVARGDIATVCVQYHDDQTLRAVKKLDAAADAHRMMVEAVLARIEGRAHAAKPKLCVYGESLGAWASQEGLINAGDPQLSSLHAALWTGTPYASSARAALIKRLEVLMPGSTADIAAASQLPPGARFAALTNADDPVAYFSGLSVLYRPAAWTRRLDKRWLPGVTFAKAILEVEAATRPRPGVREAAGHDYRATAPETLARLWLAEAFDQAEHERVEAWLTESERTRRARMAFLHSAVVERE